MSLRADLEPHNTPRRRSCDTVWFARFGGIRVRPLVSLKFITVTNGFGAAQHNSWEIDILGWLWGVFSPAQLAGAEWLPGQQPQGTGPMQQGH